MKTLDFASKLAVAKIMTDTKGWRPVLSAVLHDGSKLVATDSHRMIVLDAGSEVSEPVKLDPITGGVWQGAPVVERVRGWSIPGHSSNDGKFYKVVTGYTGADGRFPDWQRVVPNLGTEVSLTITVKELLRALDEVKPAAKENANRCQLNFSPEHIMLSSRAYVGDKQSAGVKDWQIETMMTGSTRGEMVIAFNYKYMQDICRVAKMHGNDSITLRFSDKSRPLEAVPSDWQDGEPAWRVVLMPMALS